MKSTIYIPFFTGVICFMCMLTFISAQPNNAKAGQGFLALTDTIGLRYLIDTSQLLVDERQFAAAQVILDSILIVSKRELGLENKEVADILHQMARIQNSKYNSKEAINLNQQALAIRLKLFGEQSQDASLSYEGLGINHYFAGMYFEALPYFEKVLQIRLPLFKEEDLEVASAYNLLSIIYDAIGDFEASTKMGLKTLAIRRKLLGEEDVMVGVSYNNLGIGYDQLGDPDQGIAYKHKGLAIIEKVMGDSNEYYATTVNNIGASYYGKEDFDQAIQYLEKGLAIHKYLFGETDRNTITTYNNLAGCYDGKKDYQKAIAYKKTALNNARLIYKENHPQIANLYNNIGFSYLLSGEVDTAISYLNESIVIYKNALSERHPEIAGPYYNLAKCYFKKRDYDQAINYFNKAIEIAEIITDGNATNLADYYDNLASTYLRQFYISDKDTTFLKKANDSFDKAFEIYRTQLDKVSKGAKIDLLKLVSTLGGRFLHTKKLLYEYTKDLRYKEDMINFVERSKAILLYQAIQEEKVVYFAGVDTLLQKKDRDLKIKINFFEKRRQEKQIEGLPNTNPTILATNAMLFDLNAEHEMLKKEIAQSNPTYYNMIYNFKTTYSKDIQQNVLQPYQSLLEYFVGDSSIFIFLVQPDHYEVQEVKIDTSFRRWIREMTQEGIYGHYNAPKALQNNKLKERSLKTYAEAASQLYKKLIAPIQSKLGKEVIIVPDGALGYIPFEALLKQKPADHNDLKSYQYLLHDHQISYSYSATLLKEMRDKKHRQEPSEKLLAFAPFFQGDADTLVVHVDTTDYTQLLALKDSLTALPGSGAEVKTITKLLKGTPFYGKTASIAKFQELASQYRILHLSTHGKADDRVGDYAYLAFGMPDAKGEFAKLYARDLYNLSLNADLVVLSACETGIGKLQRGEGIVSLARAFAYAGAKSIMTTLWKVRDDKTKDLVIAFYKYLKKGKSKDEALRLAKLEFLKKNADKPELTHPFFWAGMIGIGDMRAIR